PFYPEVNYPARIQALYTVDIDTEAVPKNSGTICVLRGFERYFGFFGVLFHPLTGYIKYPNNRSRFFVLEAKFNEVWLPQIVNYAGRYRKYLNGELESGEGLAAFFAGMKATGITVPEEITPLPWEAVRLRPGVAFCWSQY